MIVVIMILIIFIIVCFIFNISKTSNEDREFRIMTLFFAILFSISLGIIIHGLTTPTIEDYVNGRVETKCDTLYYKKR